MPNNFGQILDQHKLKKTTPRINVLDYLSSRDVATSQPDLENVFGKEIDRVTLYRILKTFEEKGIIHRIIDMNGTANYALCQDNCQENHHHDEHVHFNCEVCGEVYCLNHTHIPALNIPSGFKLNAIQLVATGICDKCKTKGGEQTVK